MSSRPQKRKNNALSSTMPRMIPFNEIPSEFRPLAVNISRLEEVVITKMKSLQMDFDYLLNIIVQLKKESIDLIMQAKMLQEAKIDDKKKDSLQQRASGL